MASTLLRQSIAIEHRVIVWSDTSYGFRRYNYFLEQSRRGRESTIKVITVIERDRFHPRGDLRLREEERDIVLMWTRRSTYFVFHAYSRDAHFEQDIIPAGCNHISFRSY